MKSALHGLLVIDKPLGITSRDAVNRVQEWFPKGTRIGHTGTLDPLATGVLVLCLGAATRLAEFVQEMRKVYHTWIRLGGQSDTDDAEGTIATMDVIHIPERLEIEGAVKPFLGWIDQVPPAFSAVKVGGRRAYDLARKGRAVTLAPRRVRIERIDILSYSYPELELRISCGEGTYIRSLARDIGMRLGCGGFVQTLRRLRVGSFDVEQALSLEAGAATARAGLLPLTAAVDGPQLVLDSDRVRKLRQGQRVAIAPLQLKVAGRVAVVDEANNLAAVCVLETSSVPWSLKPLKVIADSTPLARPDYGADSEPD